MNPRPRSGDTVDDDPPPRSKRPKPPPIPGTLAEMAGRPLLYLDIVATVALLAATVAASVSDSDAMNGLNIAVSTVLFLGTCILFVIGFFLAASRSRFDDLHLSGLFYLSQVAPDSVRKTFMRLWFAQMLIGAVSIATVSPPFGVMATMFGVFVNMVWSAKYGNFQPHRQEGTQRRRSAPQ